MCSTGCLSLSDNDACHHCGLTAAEPTADVDEGAAGSSEPTVRFVFEDVARDGAGAGTAGIKVVLLRGAGGIAMRGV